MWPLGILQTSSTGLLITLKFRALFTIPQPCSLLFSFHHWEGPSKQRGKAMRWLGMDSDSSLKSPWLVPLLRVARLVSMTSF